MSDARICEGDSGTRDLEFHVVASGSPRRLEIPYALTDLTTSSDDFAHGGGTVALTPQPARLVAHWGAGTFSIPHGVAIAPNGDIFAADGPTSRVLRFSKEGTLIQTITDQVSVPRGIAISATGMILVANFDGRISVYWPDGQFGQNIGGYGTDAFGVAVDTPGNIYVSEPRNNRIRKFDPGGVTSVTWPTGPPGQPQYNGPLGIAVDASGNVYAAMFDGSIRKYTPDGTLVATWTDTKGQCLGWGLHVDAAGNLLIADVLSGRVVVLDAQGTFLCEWTLDEGPEVRPGEFCANGVASDGEGNVYVTSRYSASIAHFRWDRSAGTVVVPVAGDTRGEPDETLQLQLSNTPDAKLVDGTAIGTIVNDDPVPHVDVPPVVEAVASVDASWGRDVVIEVTARDPDGDPIDALIADLRGLPGATFAVSPDHRHGTFRWRPAFGDISEEPYRIAFIARNALGGITTTLVHVSPNLVLNPSFSDLSGWTSHIGATVSDIPDGRLDGHAARLTLPAKAVDWAGINDSPNWAATWGFHRRVVMGAWVRSDLNRSNIRMQIREYQGGLLLATSTATGGPYGTTALTSEWHRLVLAYTCAAAGESDLDLTIDSEAMNGGDFDLDDVTLISTAAPQSLDVPIAPKPSLSAAIFPNPARGRAIFEVSLPVDDCLRVELYDLAGRRRAVIADEALVHAGVRRFELRDGEGALTPGVYWYRVWTRSATLQGRVVLLQ